MSSPLHDAYLYRGVRGALDLAIEDARVVCLVGPRQCGKTTFVRHFLSDREFITLDDPNQFQAAKADPLGFIRQRLRYTTIDEVQLVPELLPCVKLVVDEDPRTRGRFVLTGSADVMRLPQINDSLAGRIHTVEIAPFTESERDQSSVNFLGDLVEHTLDLTPGPVATASGLPIAERIVLGGYPEPSLGQVRSPKRWHREYLKSLINRDVHDIANVRRAQEIGTLFQLLATRTSELLNVNNLARDANLARSTVENYLTILERLFLIRRIDAWHANEGKRLIRTPKVQVTDTGLACALRKLNASHWESHREAMGHLLESFVVHQLIAQQDWFENDIRFSHFRDKEKNEVDLVIENYGEIWGIEVKASMTLHRKDFKGLELLAEASGDSFQQGLLLYRGEHIIRQPDPRILAVPIHLLWQKR